MIEIELKYYSIFLSTQLEALLWVENVIYVWWKSGEVMFTDYNHILSFLKIHRIICGDIQDIFYLEYNQFHT